jgi:hypothetical protein
MGWTMTIRYKPLFLAALMTVIAAGCCFHSDLTKTAAVQNSGMLGLQFHTTQPLTLLRDKQSHTLRLATKDYRLYPAEPLGIVEAGTSLQVNRVIKVTQLYAWMVFPVYFIWEAPLAQIESGPYAGKEVAVGGEGLSLKNGAAAMLGGPFLRPVNQDSTVAALYKLPDYYQPAPAKYAFYDSNSNEFATVTMLLPAPYFTDQMDGTWFGDLASPYVRPRTDRVLASDKLNVHELHRLKCDIDLTNDPLVTLVNLNPDQPKDFIILFIPFSETNGPVRGRWCYDTDAGTVDSGTFYGPAR